MISLSERKRLMDNDNYKLYTKDVLNLIFSNQDIDQLIPYLSKGPDFFQSLLPSVPS